jgi:hypothetical protein
MRGPLTRATSVALCVAGIWSALLLVAAFAVPVYSGEACLATVEGDGSTGCTQSSGTLVVVNGLAAVSVMGMPLVVTLIVGACLRVGSRGLRRAAWAVVAVLAVLTLLAMLSVGILLLPVTAALVVACATARSGTADPAPALARS